LREGLVTELRNLALLALLLVVAGLAWGHNLEVLILGGALYMSWFLVKINRLHRWLELGADGLPPESSGVWGDVSDQLYRLQQRNERTRRDYDALVDRVRKITSALDEGILILDTANGVRWWNPAAARLLGLQKGDLGQPITNLVRAPHFVRFIQDRQFSEPLDLVSPKRQQQLLQFSASRFGEDEVALIARDVTRLRNLEQMRKEFVANISHELRTPLTVLTGYIETLREEGENIPPHWRKPLLQMAQQTERLNLLAEDLLMLTRLESTPVPVSRATIRLAPLLRAIIDSATVLSGGRHRFRLDCDEDAELRGDSRELHSAFSNLVYNAVKHNPQGCDIAVSVTGLAHQLDVTIADNGIGIDPRHLPRLTERFYRVDDSRATSSGGTGLGLAIAKHVMLRHNGHLEIDSTPGKGSAFHCRFARV